MPRSGLSIRFLLVAAAMFCAAMLGAQTDTSATLTTDTDPLGTRLMRELTEAKLGPKTRLAVYLADPRTGVAFVDLNSLTPMRPASLLKLVTSAAALDILGADHTFETQVKAIGEIEAGAVKGNLTIVGGGDPSLGPRFQADKDDVTALIKEWAAAIQKKGIKRIEGNVLGDDRRYPAEPAAIGWDPMEFGEWYSAEVSALTFNDNCIDIVWDAGGKQGSKASFKLIPDTKYVTVASSVRTGAPSQKTSQLRYFRFRDGNEIRARGSLPPHSKKYDYAAVHDPAAFVASLLTKELRSRGVVVTGDAFNRRDIEAEDSPTSESLVLASHTSPPLRDLLPIMNGESQNLYAEVIARETALAAGQPGGFLGAARAVGLWLREKGLHRNGFAMVDGSGLSPVDRAPARLLADILRYEALGPNADLYKDALATPGTRSLKTRFVSDEMAPLKDALKAKTGYIDGSHTLAGFLRHKNGAEYLFVIMVNDYEPDRSAEAREFVDKTVLMLHNSDVIP